MAFLIQEITAAEILRCLLASLYQEGKKVFSREFVGLKLATVI